MLTLTVQYKIFYSRPQFRGHHKDLPLHLRMCSNWIPLVGGEACLHWWRGGACSGTPNQIKWGGGGARANNTFTHVLVPGPTYVGFLSGIFSPDRDDF